MKINGGDSEMVGGSSNSKEQEPLRVRLNADHKEVKELEYFYGSNEV